MPAGELPGLLEGLIMWASSLVGPVLGFWMVGWLVGDGGCSTLVLFQHGSTPCLHKQLISEDKMFWIASSLSWGPHGSSLGSLLSRYTSWYRSQISFREVQ